MSCYEDEVWVLRHVLALRHRVSDQPGRFDRVMTDAAAGGDAEKADEEGDIAIGCAWSPGDGCDGRDAVRVPAAMTHYVQRASHRQLERLLIEVMYRMHAMEASRMHRV